MRGGADPMEGAQNPDPMEDGGPTDAPADDLNRLESCVAMLSGNCARRERTRQKPTAQRRSASGFWAATRP